MTNSLTMKVKGEWGGAGLFKGQVLGHPGR
jgi:hypothetical protein